MNAVAPDRGRVRDVLAAFAKLGVTSFGGPIAHVGYFRDEFVTRRAWLSDREYGDLVALAQFLPGPASSQIGFAIGLRRAGVAGALTAFAAFTLPSFVIMIAVAAGADLVRGPVGAGVVDGLKAVAVAVVAHAVWGMARTLTPDARRATIAVVAAALALGVGGTLGQILAIVTGVISGMLVLRAAASAPPVPAPRIAMSRAAGIGCLAFAGMLLVGLPVLARLVPDGTVALFDAFYRAGALVFGGGHVVLPLLDAATVHPGWIGTDEFLTGYAAAQAVPGPLFTFAAYVGALSDVGPRGLMGATIATIAIFLPGLLLMAGVLPFWSALRARSWAGPALAGANAAVVGILGAALYTPVFTSAVTGVPTFLLALCAFVLLVAWRVPPWVVVLTGAAVGAGVLSLLPG